MKKDILFPGGRLVGGSPTRPETTDAKGAPLVNKKTGQPIVKYQFGVAIAKGNETHWNQTPWGALIWAAGTEGYPGGETQRLDFSWKVTDGDSQIPNKRGNKPCDREGQPRHWVIWFSSQMPPKQLDIIGNRVGDAPRPLAAGMEIKCGYYVQVFGTVVDNKPSDSPGVYINHSALALYAYGEEISQGPDVSQMGFGTGLSMPAGASLAPQVAAGAMPPQTPATPPPMPAARQPVTPVNDMTPAAAPPPPPASPPPPPPAGPPMTQGCPYTYEQLKMSGYSDDQMRAQGYLQ